MAGPILRKKSVEKEPGKPLPNSVRSTTSPLAGAVLLGVLTVAVYIPAMRAQFIWDDDDYVQNNMTLRSAEGLRQIWFRIGATPQYYPLVHTSFWIEFRLWGLHPAGYHLVNICLHTVAAILLWRILLILELPGAWVAAAIFALHPIQVESVAWITERKNVLSAVFYLGAALAYLRFEGFGGSHKSRASNKWYALAAFLFLCALLSKTVTASLPAALLLVLWWKQGYLKRRQLAGLVPLIPLGIAFGLLTAFLEKRVVGAIGEEWNLTFLDRCLIAGRAIWFYAEKLLFPVNLAFIYPRWRIDHLAWQQYLFPLAAIALIVALWLLRRRLGTGPLIATLFFGGTLFPALGFFNVYPMRYSFVADHFQYLASIGLIVLVVAFAHRAATSFGPKAGTVRSTMAAIVLTVLCVLTFLQTRVYADLETLWTDTIRKTPDAWLAHNNLGNLLRDKGNVGDAREHIEKAMEHFREAVRLNPRDPFAYNNIAGLLIGMGRIDEAIEQSNQALRLDPNYADAHRNLALALAASGRTSEAISHCRDSLRIRPDNADVLNNLAWFLVTNADPKIRREQEGLGFAERAARLTNSNNPAILDTLAAAYAATGQFDRAVTTAGSAMALASAAGQSARASSIGRRQMFYRQHKPYREPPAPAGQ
jgi:tetratricopeptide (TPR) repeat protein